MVTVIHVRQRQRSRSWSVCNMGPQHVEQPQCCRNNSGQLLRNVATGSWHLVNATHDNERKNCSPQSACRMLHHPDFSSLRSSIPFWAESYSASICSSLVWCIAPASWLRGWPAQLDDYRSQWLADWLPTVRMNGGMERLVVFGSGIGGNAVSYADDFQVHYNINRPHLTTLC